MTQDPALPPGCTNAMVDGIEGTREFEQGCEAYEDGISRTDNPYNEYHKRSARAHRLWDEGWLCAKAEAGDESEDDE